jgi:hypothetical protein
MAVPGAEVVDNEKDQNQIRPAMWEPPTVHTVTSPDAKRPAASNGWGPRVPDRSAKIPVTEPLGGLGLRHAVGVWSLPALYIP